MKTRTLAFLALLCLLAAGCTQAEKDALARDAAAFGWKGVRDVLGAAIELATSAPSNPDDWATWAKRTGAKFGKDALLGAAGLLDSASPETINALTARQSLPPTDEAPRAIGFVLPSSASSGTRASSTGGALGMTAGPAGASSGTAVAGAVSSTSRAADPRAAARWLIENPGAW